jgi:hypothetical protein
MSEVFINEEIEFSLDDEDYFWVGSYEVITESEDETINILGTIQLSKWDSETNKSIDVVPTRAFEQCIIETILDKL